MPAPSAVLLLEVDGPRADPDTLWRAIGAHVRARREIAVELGQQSPEEVLAACARARIEVRRSRVVRSRECG